MNKTGRKIKGIVTAIAMIMSIIPSVGVHANNESNAASAAFGSIKAECVNMSAVQSNPVPVLKEKVGRTGWELNPQVYASSYIRCKIEDTFMSEIQGEYTPVVQITYFDEGYGGFCLYYDSRTGKKGEFVQLENSGVWQTKTFYLYDAHLGGRVYTDDFWIATNLDDVMGKSSEPVIIASVSVTKSEKAAPFDISVTTDKTGNIFFEGDAVKFDITYNNVTDRKYAFQAEYRAKDYIGNTVKTYTVQKQAGVSLSDSVTFYNLPYGVYKLHIKLTGSSIEQEYTTEFSYSRKADKTNYHFGTNIHYDDETYTKEDAKALSDLIKNSGFGFVRSSLRWHQIEKSKGVYKIPDTVRFANRYLDEIGLEMLAVVYTENRLYLPPPFYNLNEAQMTAFRNYCKYVAEELKDDTDYFCMLNEINHDSSGYLDNQQEYVNISKAGYEGIKQGNPNAFINGGSLAGWSRDYANKTYELGILDYCDSYSMHIYDHTHGPETYYMYTSEQDHKDNLKRYDKTGTKQAWITESGWPTRAADDTAKEEVSRAIAMQHDSASELRQAQWYARSMALNGDTSRIDKFFYYSMSDNGIDKFDIQSNFGILRAKNYAVPFAAKPAYVAVCAYNDIVGNAEFVKDMITDGTGYAYQYRKEDGSEVVCLWAAEYYNQTGGTYNYQTDAPYAAVYDLYGNVRYIETKNGTCAVPFTQEPVYVTSANSKPEPPKEPEPTEPPAEFIDSIHVVQDGEPLKALWFLNPQEKITVTFETGQPVNTSMTVICAAYNKGRLSGIESQTIVTDAEVAKVSFTSDYAVNADSIKLMVFDGFLGLKPLQNAVQVDYFDRNASVIAKTENGLCTVMGQLKDGAENENVMITVFSQNTRKSALTEESAAPYMLYQNQIRSGKNGMYEFSFRLPPNYKESSAMVMVATEKDAVQSVMPAVR